ncbi:MAG: dipeptide ABC transporter ATP-binding protein [Burkholderiales bacterium]|nr:dipeptide ABC transporter ATP-binding protein [Burkholderiales bacterium]
MTPPLLQIDDLRTWISGAEHVVRAVDGLSMTLERGETFALLGESGCGKSLTALSILRLLPEAARIAGGTVRLDGVDLVSLSERRMREVRGRRIGMIFQEPGASLNPVMTVGDQIREVLSQHIGLRGSAADKRVLSLLDAVGIPDPKRRLDEYPFQLSGGLKQRIMIAAAIACEPELLVADEPTTALDVTIQAQVLELLRDLQRRTGMAMLLITHDLGVVSEMAHRVAVMYAGEIVETAPRDRFFADPRHPYTRMLFASLPGRTPRGGRIAAIKGTVPPLWLDFPGCRFVDRCPLATDLCRRTPPPRVPFESGWLRCHHPEHPMPIAGVAAATSAVSAPAVSGAPPLLEVDGLSVHFPIRRGLLRRTVGYVRAVDGLSLRLEAGRTLALVGESGCGKTTAGKSIVQLLRANAGSVRIDGEALGGLCQRDLRDRRREFQIIFQDPFASLDPRMRIFEIIEEGMVALGVGATRHEREHRIDTLLEQVGLGVHMKHRYPHEFSGGQRQRIAIARALAVEPKLIVCDEPTSALDVSVQAQILNLLKDLQDHLGIAYVFITHNVSVVEYLAHDVAVMYLGRIVEHGSVDEVLRAPRHPYTEALLAAVPSIDRPAGPSGERRPRLFAPGDLPSPAAPPAGCHFHPRCMRATDACRTGYPAEVRVSPTHRVHCIDTV